VEIKRINNIDKNCDPRLDGRSKNIYSLRIKYIKSNDSVDAHIVIEYGIDNGMSFDVELEKESSYTYTKHNRISEYVVTYLSLDVEVLKNKENQLALNLMGLIKTEYDFYRTSIPDFKSAMETLNFRELKLNRVLKKKIKNDKI